jgi:hypothetical protein
MNDKIQEIERMIAIPSSSISSIEEASVVIEEDQSHTDCCHSSTGETQEWTGEDITILRRDFRRVKYAMKKLKS